jgi:hypothetical protein
MNSKRLLSFAVLCLLAAPAIGLSQEPIHVGFLWHMHQPVYYPYESVVTTDALGRFSFSVVDVHNQRFGPYTGWPRDAVQTGLALPHLGAQVSFSGSLIENLGRLDAAGINGGMWNSWENGYQQAVGWATSMGNPRLDMVAFGYHHPLMPLLDDDDIRMQIRLFRHVAGATWGAGGPSRGMFPAETAFSARMIPALAAEGVEWVLVDNIHFDRACIGYPHTNASNLFAPNPADQINPDPAAGGGAWVQLNNLWAPSRVSAPIGYQPHHVQHVDPETGAITRIVAVPAARYEGNEDGRGGYGAFLYDQVMDQYLSFNTDAAHPMFVVLHHDGDNYGGGADAYYHSNFQNMVAWASGDADYDVTTVQDYLDRFPVDLNDVIHVEDGSWAGADNGDAEFKKWLGDPNGSGWCPDRNSWAVLTAAKNRVFMAEDASPAASMQAILDGTGTATEKAWHFLLVSEASDYWYWDGTEIWDSNVTRGCNQAVAHADAVIAGQPDTTPPTVFVPQREPYNPGGFEWSTSPEPSDFEVWTLAYDVSGLTSVTLHWRVDNDGTNPLSSIQNETYAGGGEVGAWNGIAMSAMPMPAPPAGILDATYRAERYVAEIVGRQDVLIDYYVEAVDSAGNTKNTDIQHVYVGDAMAGGNAVTWTPNPPVAGQSVTLQYNPAGRPLANAAQVFVHVGFNNWSPVLPDSAMTWNAAESVWEASIAMPASASQWDFVFNDGAGTWDNNDGADWHVSVQGGGPPAPTWVLDGALDAEASLVASNGGRSLHAGVIGDTLYVATDDAGEGSDGFVLVAQVPGAMRSAPWAKAGQVADWSAFLADENDNDYEGWFDASGATGAATGANGGVLEGTLDLTAEMGSVPLVIYLCVGSYASPDGGALASQVPAGSPIDSDVTANEYVAFSTVLPGDCNGDWRVDSADAASMVEILLGADAPERHFAAADMDGSGFVDGNDLGLFVGLLLG